MSSKIKHHKENINKHIEIIVTWAWHLPREADLATLPRLDTTEGALRWLVEVGEPNPFLFLVLFVADSMLAVSSSL